MFVDHKEVIRRCQSNLERKTMQWAKEKKDKEPNNDLQNNLQKTEDWATRTSQKEPGWTQILLKVK